MKMIKKFIFLIALASLFAGLIQGTAMAITTRDMEWVGVHQSYLTFDCYESPSVIADYYQLAILQSTNTSFYRQVGSDSDNEYCYYQSDLCSYYSYLPFTVRTQNVLSGVGLPDDISDNMIVLGGIELKSNIATTVDIYQYNRTSSGYNKSSSSVMTVSLSANTAKKIVVPAQMRRLTASSWTNDPHPLTSYTSLDTRYRAYGQYGYWIVPISKNGYTLSVSPQNVQFDATGGYLSNISSSFKKSVNITYSEPSYTINCTVRTSDGSKIPLGTYTQLTSGSTTYDPWNIGSSNNLENSGFVRQYTVSPGSTHVVKIYAPAGSGWTVSPSSYTSTSSSQNSVTFTLYPPEFERPKNLQASVNISDNKLHVDTYGYYGPNTDYGVGFVIKPSNGDALYYPASYVDVGSWATTIPLDTSVSNYYVRAFSYLKSGVTFTSDHKIPGHTGLGLFSAEGFYLKNVYGWCKEKNGGSAVNGTVTVNDSARNWNRGSQNTPRNSSYHFDTFYVVYMATGNGDDDSMSGWTNKTWTNTTMTAKASDGRVATDTFVYNSSNTTYTHTFYFESIPNSITVKSSGGSSVKVSCSALSISNQTVTSSGTPFSVPDKTTKYTFTATATDSNYRVTNSPQDGKAGDTITFNTELIPPTDDYTVTFNVTGSDGKAYNSAIIELVKGSQTPISIPRTGNGVYSKKVKADTYTVSISDKNADGPTSISPALTSTGQYTISRDVSFTVRVPDKEVAGSTVYGWARVKGTSAYLTDVTVTLLSSGKQPTLTFSNSYFYISDVPAGTYNVTFAKSGYKSVKKQVVVSEGKAAQVNTYMERN